MSPRRALAGPLTAVALLLFALPAAAQTRAPFDISRLTPGRDSFAIIVQGAQIGSTITVTERTPTGARITDRSAVAGLIDQTTVVEVTAAGRMSRVSQKGTIQGEETSIEVTYRQGRVSGTARTMSADGPLNVKIDTTVAAGVVDDNAVQGLLPSLEWAPGATFSVPVFSAAQNEGRATTLQVMGTEPVPLASGPVEAYRVRWTGSWQEATFWVSTARPHRVLRIAIAGTPLDIILVP